MTRALWLALASSALLAACSGTPEKPSPPDVARDTVPGKSPYAPAREDPSKRGDYTAGGLYAPHVKDSAPDELPDVDRIPEPEVVAEPRSRYGNRSPYKVLGKSYRVLDTAEDYEETGIASYYGNKFHGRRTSNLEVYDMYAFTAAHKSLPLPSYARVTNLDNGKSVVVRVNDRGPFHEGRVIDLSLAAAVKLGIQSRGTGRVEVVGLVPGDDAPRDHDTVASNRPAPQTALPAGLAGNDALQLPPGVHIATGKPQPAPPSAMDRLVGDLPDGATATAAAATAAAPAPAQASDPDWRFDMRQDGRAMTADEFDAWMKARRARVATGKAGRPDPQGSAAPVPAPETAAAARNVAAGAPRSAAGDGVTLQVAAFGSRTNAERALSMLHGAGVAGARLQDGVSAGKQVWRLRVGPVESARIRELSDRVAGLGFGRPQVVRE